MKKIVLLALAVGLTVSAGAQQKWHYDSTKVEKLTEVVVSGVRAQKDAPYAVSNLKRQELAQFATSGQEMPLLFAVRRASWHGARTVWARARRICVSAVPATRAST